MPAEGIHITAFREASTASGLSPEVRRAVMRHEDAGRLGAVLMDMPYFDHYAEEVVRYAARLKPRASPWGAVVHEEAAVPIVFALARAAHRARSSELAVLALGAASHATIDRAMHPLVNALARRHHGGRDHDGAHREVEKFQSICFHEEYFGQDRMGTDGIVRLVRVPFGELFAKQHVRQAVCDAYSPSIPNGPTETDLARMGSGYELHARLIGSPVGRLVASEKEKSEARPKFLYGGWGRFEQVLEEAIQRSVGVLERTWAVFAAGDGEREARLRELEKVLPRGTIDGRGDDVELDMPFAAR
ncbi:MAG: hypothetical protein HOW73_00465 [Polyangiaceae bacterium]|nr:hypothetical protein [Polyangiaceae bacterium]